MIPGTIILGEQEDEEDFDDRIHDIQHQHNDENSSNYVPNSSDEDDESLGSWEAKYVAMDEKEVMIVTDDNTAKGGYINEH